MNYRIYNKEKQNIQGSASFRYKHYEITFGKMCEGGVSVQHLGGMKQGLAKSFKDMDEAMEYIERDREEEIRWDD